MAHQGPMDQMETQAPLAPWDPPVVRDLKDHQDEMERMANLDHLGKTVHQEEMAHQDRLV